jgi:DNA-binding FrmR family transcriptional regulator
MNKDECVRHKSTPRSEALKRSLTSRLNRAIGQLNGIKAMVEEDRYCGDVLTQLAAAESAVRAVSREVLRNHLETCVVERVQAGDIEVVDEMCELLRKFV